MLFCSRVWSECRQEDREYWEMQIRACDSLNARRAADRIDWGNRLGLPTEWSEDRIRRFAKTMIPCEAEFFKWKKQDPDKVVITQIGKFFEAVGIDAVMLIQVIAKDPPRAASSRTTRRSSRFLVTVQQRRRENAACGRAFLPQHCGVAQMGENKIRAGFPVEGFEKRVSMLLEAGLSVKIYVQEPGKGPSEAKTRIGLPPVTPAIPVVPHVGLFGGEGLILLDFCASSQPWTVAVDLTAEALSSACSAGLLCEMRTCARALPASTVR